jgi:hypothetical protein
MDNAWPVLRDKRANDLLLLVELGLLRMMTYAGLGLELYFS